MQRYFSSGGLRNPDFRYKIKVTSVQTDHMAAISWCDNYPTKSPDGYFERYYVDWGDGSSESKFVIFQFEQEEPAIMFALKFVK